MNNVKSIIQSHNSFILSKHNNNNNVIDNNDKCDNHNNINKSFNYKLTPTSRTFNKVDSTVPNSSKSNNKYAIITTISFIIM